MTALCNNLFVACIRRSTTMENKLTNNNIIYIIPPVYYDNNNNMWMFQEIFVVYHIIEWKYMHLFVYSSPKGVICCILHIDTYVKSVLIRGTDLELKSVVVVDSIII